MLDVDVIDEPAAAAAALDPLRARLLAALAEPGSASTLAGQVGLTRQKVNYHLRTLEAHGLVREVGAASAARAHRADGRGDRGVVPGLPGRARARRPPTPPRSPTASPPATCSPSRARIVREVGDLARRADREDKRLATLALDTEIAFASPAERAAFADELGAAVRDLAARYHDPAGRPHRLVVGVHPTPAPTPESEEDPS